MFEKLKMWFTPQPVAAKHKVKQLSTVDLIVNEFEFFTEYFESAVAIIHEKELVTPDISFTPKVISTELNGWYLFCFYNDNGSYCLCFSRDPKIESPKFIYVKQG